MICYFKNEGNYACLIKISYEFKAEYLLTIKKLLFLWVLGSAIEKFCFFLKKKDNGGSIEASNMGKHDLAYKMQLRMQLLMQLYTSWPLIIKRMTFTY